MLSYNLRAVMVLFVASGLAAGCSARDPDGRTRPDGGGTVTPTEDSGTDRVDSGQAAFVDPFDPDSACGASAIPTIQVPGSLLLVFDRSGSMDFSPGNEDDGEPSKWDVATAAINETFVGLPDDLNMGLMLFPTPGPGTDSCTVDPTPQVPVGPLTITRSSIASVLGDRPGGGTPLVDALRKGWAHLDTLDTTGLKGVILVTDGGEGCEFEMLDAVLEEAQNQRVNKGYLTYAVGLDQANNFLSTLAIRGGTPRKEICLGECTSRTCLSSAECPGAASCFQPLAGEPGFCGCTNNSECVAPQTCLNLPVLGGQCLGEADCCHYNAGSANFDREFRATLGEIAERFLDSCVFEVPKGDDFDPALVNVGVTFEGEDRDTLPFGEDATINSWQYADPNNDTVVIQGPICSDLLMNPATVEIVAGCPTLLI